MVCLVGLPIHAWRAPTGPKDHPEEPAPAWERGIAENPPPLMEVGCQQRLGRGWQRRRGAPDAGTALPEHPLHAQSVAMPLPGRITHPIDGMPSLEELPPNAILVGTSRPARSWPALPRPQGSGTRLGLLILPKAKPHGGLVGRDLAAGPAHGFQPGRQWPLRPARLPRGGNAVEYLPSGRSSSPPLPRPPPPTYHGRERRPAHPHHGR